MVWRPFWILRDEQGSALLQYLILALIIGGIAVAIVGGLKSALAGLNNTAVENITNITSSGF